MQGGSGARVLTTDDVSGWNRAALAAVRALAGTAYRPVVTVSGPRSLAAASRWCTGTVLVPPGGRPGYAEALRRVVDEGDYAAVLPASDVALLALGDPAVPLVDKAALAGLVRAAGLESVPGDVYAGPGELRDAADGLDYPVVVKSVVKSGVENLQAVRVDTAADVRRLGTAPGALLVQPFVDEPLRAISGVVWDGRYLALCHQEYVRLWPPRAGVASAAVTTGADRDLEDAVLRLLGGHRGVFQVQLLGRYVLDVNPRVYGSMPLAAGAGANLPLLAVEAAAGRAPDAVVRARPGVRYRWLEGDVRHLVTAVHRGELRPGAALRAALPHHGTVHSVESLRDPWPAVTRARGVLAGRRVGAV